MKTITSIKTDCDDFQVEYEVLSNVDDSCQMNSTQREITYALRDISEEIGLCEEEINKLSAEIDRLTNHADGLDYAVAVASGILTGLLDSIFVGKIDIKTATENAEKKIADKVKKKALEEKQANAVKKAIEGAKKKGKKLSKEQIEQIKKNVEKSFLSDPNNLSETGQDPVLKRAIRYLAKNHPIPQDNLYIGTGSSASTHHLDDIAHHFSLAGMIAAIVVQYFRVATFVNKEGKWKTKFVKTDVKELVEMWLPMVISGLLNWLVCIAEKNINTEEADKLPEPIFKVAHLLASTPAIVQVIKSVDKWCMHLYSDVAGSESSKGRGAGIPGLFISLLKEISSVPPLNLTGLPKFVDYLYTTKKIDLRTEVGIGKELGKQAVPVIINEVIVRTFYFVRHLVGEYKKHDSFEGIDWQNVIPYGNRTIARMLTIASGTFTAVDIADAAIRGAANSGGTLAGFAKEFILRVNFVGVGRFAIAVGVDVGMGIKRNKLRNERMDTYNRMLLLSGAKVYYLEAGMWCNAIETSETLNRTIELAESSVAYFKESWQNIEENMQIVEDELNYIVAHDSEFAQELLDELDY